MKTWICVLIGLIGLPIGLGQQPGGAAGTIDYEKMGQALVTAVLKGSLEEYQAILTPDTASAFTPEAVRKLSTDLTARFGKFVKVRLDEKQKTGQFDRIIYELEFEKGKTLMVLVLENEDKIARILFPDMAAPKPPRPTTMSPPTSFPPTSAGTPPARPAQESKSELRLPFSGKWKVLNGGTGANQHSSSRALRYGYDFAIIGIDERRFRTDGKKNEDYYAFGKEVVAPAAGVVAQIIDGIEDNMPGQVNPYYVLGNMVVIDHQNGEFSVLAHLAKGSIRVKERQKVQPGDTLGLCGNSGDSLEAHVHYHLQDQPYLIQSNGLPVMFTHYFSGNKPVEKGVPEYGESVSN